MTRCGPARRRSGCFPGLSKDELALVGVPYRWRFRWLDDVVAL
jgi:hypothetical protein